MRNSLPGLSDVIVNPRTAAEHEEFPVELLGIGKDGEKDVGQKRPEDELDLVLFQQLLEVDGCLFRIAASVRRDQVELVGGITDLEAAGLVDLIDGDRDALG